MRCDRIAFVALLAALSVGATACSSHKSSAKTTSVETTSSAVLPVEKRGVLTIPMATVGDPESPMRALAFRRDAAVVLVSR
jgi:hypothetical protein